MLKNNLKYILLVILLVIVLSLVANSNHSVIKPHTTYYFKNYKQYSNNGKNNNVVKGVKGTLLSKVVLAKNINGVSFDTTPVVSGDMEYIGTMNRTKLTGALYAIKRTTGKVVWHDSFSNWIMTNPVVVPQIGMVFVGSGNSKHYGKTNGVSFRGTGNNYIYAIDLGTGKIAWKYKTVGENMPTPIYKSGVLYFVNGNRTFYALSVKDGKLLWSLNVGSIVSMSSPVMIGNNVYFGGADPYAVFDVNIKSKSIAWKDTMKGITGALDDTTPTYSNGFIYTNSTKLVNYKKNQGNEYLYKINATNGNIIWKMKEGYGVLNLPTDPMEGSVSTIVGDVLYTSSNAARELLAVNTNTQKILWKFKVSGMVNAPFIIIKNLIYSITGDGNVYVLDIKNGEFIAKRTLGGPELASGMSFYSGKFYVATGNGNIYTFK
ncbi:PQQ-binding-like beta-propeller repeat protein [Patescibacteria group bacterium]|nr:PQQ-binding-like beta-propeller repeat protein [Patescibacteria group bacterium]